MNNRELFLAMLSFVSDGDQIDVLKEVLDPDNYGFVPPILEEWIYYELNDHYFDEILTLAPHSLVSAVFNSDRIYLSDKYIRLNHESMEFQTLTSWQYDDVLLEDINKIREAIYKLDSDYLNDIDWMQLVNNYCARILPEYATAFDLLLTEYEDVSNQGL